MVVVEGLAVAAVVVVAAAGAEATKGRPLRFAVIILVYAIVL